MQKRTALILTAAALLLCILAAALYLRFKAPPEVARLLPESDAILYLDLAHLRPAFHGKPLAHAPEYQDFTDQTGIDFERDLDQVAFGIEGMADPNGPNGPVAFSEVFLGHFDRDRLTRYLAAKATRQESYAGATIYDVPSENRTLRVALLGPGMVAASNAPTSEQIHSMLDRSRAGPNPFAGASLLSAHYRDVPLLAHQVWAIGRLGLPFAQNGRVSLAGFTLPLSAETVFVASLAYTGTLHLKVEAFAANDAEAARMTASLGSLLGLARNLERLRQQPGPSSSTPDELKLLTDSVAITQAHDRVTLTATIPDGALQHLNR